LQARDGRIYFLDFARLFPPEPPNRNIRGGILFRQLRPEFVHSNPAALSSDAFSRFGLLNAAKHNNQVKRAFKRMVVQVVPEFVLDLINAQDPDVYAIDDFRQLLACSQYHVTALLHRKGINVRFLGVVWAVLERAQPVAPQKLSGYDVCICVCV
jgi:hypothetical protein